MGIMIKRYGILGTMRLIVSLIYTKIFFRHARLIRLPFDIRNKSNIKIGKNFTSGFGCRIEAFPLNEHLEICISIGNDVFIVSFSYLLDIIFIFVYFSKK